MHTRFVGWSRFPCTSEIRTQGSPTTAECTPFFKRCGFRTATRNSTASHITSSCSPIKYSRRTLLLRHGHSKCRQKKNLADRMDLPPSTENVAAVMNDE